MAKDTTRDQGQGRSNARVHQLQYELWSLKEALPADMASSPFLKFQISAAQLLLGEMFLPGSPIGLTPNPYSLAQSISAVKSLMNIFISAEPGQEMHFTNLAWVMLGYGLSLGVRLDILCTTCGISAATAAELRRSLSISQILRRVVERLRTSISQDTDTDAQLHPFCPLLSRAEAVDSWYARHGPSATPDCNPAGSENAAGTEQVDHQRSINPTHPHPNTVEEDKSFGTMDDQDLAFAQDPEMQAFEGLDFAGTDFTIDPQEVWNPFVFPDGAY
ncbi:hypothetical protein diail_11767 [Diaporthe ilicicola]|nr:hypothetical protein diail_11767 [Diaporthe ilicicola]